MSCFVACQASDPAAVVPLYLSSLKHRLWMSCPLRHLRLGCSRILRLICVPGQQDEAGGRIERDNSQSGLGPVESGRKGAVRRRTLLRHSASTVDL